MRFFQLILTTLGMFLAVAPASAAVQIVSTEGQLIGATGVIVDGLIYDVSFVDGLCTDNFDGCDDPSDLDFTDAGTALLAAQALLDQVFLDTELGAFDSQPSLTLGCGNPVLCNVLIPHTLNYFGNPDLGQAAVAANAAPAFPNPDMVKQSSILVGSISGAQALDTYARFTQIGAVPEASAWAMMILGLGFAGAGLRRRQSQNCYAVA